MILPKLKVIQAFKEITKCGGMASCAKCELFVGNGGRCSGCSTEHQAEMKGTAFSGCYGSCHTCVGFKTDYTAICCRSPLKNTYLTAVARGKDWNNPKYKFIERPALSFKDKAVFYVSSGGVNTIAPGNTKLVEDREVAAVNLSRVWGGNGFYSKDLKDYLHLPKKTKLILVTMTLDDLLERGWKKEMYAEPESFYTNAGVDAWMPLAFSAYPHEANMHQYYQFLRTMIATEMSKAWFVSGDYLLRSVRIDDLYEQVLTKVPQVMFNTQFIRDEHSFRYHLNIFKTFHKMAPPSSSFWFVGASTPAFMHNTRKVCGDRPLYFLSPKMLYLASKGQALTLAGGSEKSELSKHDLLQQNVAMFSRTVLKYSGASK